MLCPTVPGLSSPASRCVHHEALPALGEPFVVHLLISSVLVEGEQRLVDLLAEGTPLIDGDAVLLRSEDGTDDLEHAVPALCCPVLQRGSVEDDGLNLTLHEHVVCLIGGRHFRISQATLGQIFGGGGPRHRGYRLARQIIGTSNARPE